MSDLVNEITLNLRVQEKYDTAKNWETNNPILLAGELGIESDTGLFKFGDGSSNWNSIEYANVPYKEFENRLKDTRTKVFMASKTDRSVSDSTVIELAFGESGHFKSITPAEGDIFIVLVDIAGKQIQTPYIYQTRLNGAGWVAMSSLFEADKVVLTKNIKLAGNYQNIGNISIDDGEIQSEGMLVSDLFDKIFTKEIDPSITAYPSGGIYLRENTVDGNYVQSSYEAGTRLTLAYTSYFDRGSYSYKSTENKSTIIPVVENGVEILGYTPSDNASSSDLTALINHDSGVIGEIQILDSGYNFTLRIEYSDGNYALTNTDNLPETDVRIAAGSVDATVSILAHRNIFYGYISDNETLTSSKIRALNGVKSESRTLFLDENVDAKKIVLALPTERTLGSVVMPSSMDIDVTAEFVEQATKMNIPGANNYTSREYTIYVYEPRKMGGSYMLEIL